MRALPPLAILLAAVPAWAQSTAALTGAVIDASGAVIVQASVICRNVDTGLTLSAASNGEGLFRCPDLPVGLYDVSISKGGFDKLIRTGIRLLTGQTVDLTFTLRIGQANQSVEVTAPAPLVQRATSDLGAIVDERQMTDLPLNGRNVFDLAELTPGAIETDAATIPGQQDNIGMAINGNRSIDNNWQLDGGTYTNRNWGSAPTLPNPDTIQEFSVRTSNFDASNRGAGANVKLTTRSGTNALHGTLFEFLRNDAMDARNFFDTRVQPYKQNQYGATIGGPVKRDQLFYFASFQATNQRGSPSPRVMTVPDALERNGDFSRSGKTIVDPATNAPFPGNLIPRARMDSIALGLIPHVPLPTSGGNRFYATPYANLDDYQWMAKIDYNLGVRDHLFGRYFWDQNTRQRDVASIPGIYADNQYHNQTVMVSDTHTFSPTWVMTASFNYLRTFRHESPMAPVSMQQLGAKVPCASGNDCGTKIYVQLTGYTSLAISGGGISQPQAEEAVADVSHQSGRHFIRFGSSFRHTSDYAFGLNDSEAGKWTFNATRTSSTSIKNSGDSYASFLLGLPAQFAQATSTPNDFLVTTGDAFLQDDWKIAPRLTLNLGLRYEPWLFPHDARGFLPGFWPGHQSTLAPLAPLGLLFAGDYGLPPSIVQSDWHAFSPRFGLAWDMFGGGKTILRGGYGIFRTSTEFFGMVSTAAGSVPFRTASVSIADPPSTADPYAGYGPIPFPYTVPSSLANYQFPANTAIRTMDPAARAGYIQSWNATIERQVARDTAITVSWVGNHALGLMNRYQNNPGLCCWTGMPSAVNNRRLYPGFGNLTIQGSFGKGNYEALQVQVNKRTARGFTVLANYTYAKAMGIDSSGAFGTALSTAPRDPYNLNLDYGPSDHDLTHTGKIALLYDLPKLRTGPTAFLRIVNGWQVNAMITARTGFPFTCKSGVDNSKTGINNDNCDQVDPRSARPAGADPMLDWFNTAAFTQNAVQTFGTAGRNNMRRPGFYNTNLSVFRHFRLTEKLQAELRAEAFNALNHPNLDILFITNSYTNNANFTSPTFGQLIHASDPRLMQLALKLRF